MNPPNTMLKVIVLIHFILSLWASQSPRFLPTSYIYMNVFILSFGTIGIFAPESSDAILMFIVSLLISVIQDIVFLGIYEPRGQQAIKSTTTSVIGEFRFSLGMCILNLLIKPVSVILLLRILKSRTADYDNFNFPGMNNIPGFGAGTGQRGGTYENIDQAPPYSPPSAPQDNREKQAFP